jgi:hypothetical protein
VVEHLPEPEEGLDRSPLRQVDLPVVLGLHGRVAGIERRDERLHRQRDIRVLERRVGVDGPPEVELGQGVAHGEVAFDRRVVELLGQVAEKAREHVLSDGSDSEVSEGHRRATVAKR